MRDLWRALVSDGPATVDANLPAIFDDLSKNMASKQWRTREACVTALADALAGRRYENVRGRLEDLMNRTFHLLDDIKASIMLARRADCSWCTVQESVRTASQSLARTLVKFIERVCDSRLTSAHDVRDALAEVVPVLLTKVGCPARRL
jgi:proteasome component ECM29